MKLFTKITNLFKKKPVLEENKYAEELISNINLTPVSLPTTCECQGCKKKLSILSYSCPYCNKFHCEKHRLPEDHYCPKPKNPFYDKNCRLGFKGKSKIKIYMPY